MDCIIRSFNTAAHAQLVGVAMRTYVFYHRTLKGSIERLANLISDHPDLRGSYNHEESLVDFPETTVFWAEAEGESLGVAPVVPPSTD